LFTNADMGAGQVQQLCILTTEARQLLDVTVRRMRLNARSYHRVLKLSRTIADIDDKDMIEVQHVAEAVQYRQQQQVAG
jgi:magnesium chelatase family protein